MEDFLDLNNNMLNSKHQVHKFSIKIDFDIDTKFLAIIPTFNINFYSRTIEIEWIVFGLYIDYLPNKN